MEQINNNSSSQPSNETKIEQNENMVLNPKIPESNKIIPVPKPHKHRGLSIFLGSLFLIVILFSIGLFIAPKYWNKSSQVRPDIQVAEKPNYPQATYSFLKEKTKFKPPVIFSENKAALEDMPVEIQKLILPGAKEAIYFKTEFGESRQGYKVIYKIEGDLHLLRQTFQNIFGETIKGVLTTDSDVIIEAEGQNYRIQLTQNIQEDQINLVTIEYF